MTLLEEEGKNAPEDEKKGIQQKMQQLRERDERRQQVITYDMYTVKLRDLPADVNEDIIREKMASFGKIDRIKVPQQETIVRGRGKMKHRGFCFVTYYTEEECARAIEEQEVTIGMSVVKIEQAHERKREPRQQDQQYMKDFHELRRRY